MINFFYIMIGILGFLKVYTSELPKNEYKDLFQKFADNPSKNTPIFLGGNKEMSPYDGSGNHNASHVKSKNQIKEPSSSSNIKNKNKNLKKKTLDLSLSAFMSLVKRNINEPEWVEYTMCPIDLDMKNYNKFKKTLDFASFKKQWSDIRFKLYREREKDISCPSTIAYIKTLIKEKNKNKKFL